MGGAAAEIVGIMTDRQGTVVAAVGKNQAEIKRINDQRRADVELSMKTALVAGGLGFTLHAIARYMEETRLSLSRSKR